MSVVPHPILVVCGTDTGVGKTAVAAAVLELCAAQGMHVAAMKPAESGCTSPEQSDAHALWRAAGAWQDFEEVLLYSFPEPLAPAVAAAAHGVHIELTELEERAIRAAASAELLLLEGAGGLMVPYADDWRFIDLLTSLYRRSRAQNEEQIRLGVLLVVGSKLGAINHAVLSLEAIRARELPLIGYVLNHPLEKTPAEAAALETNRAVIQREAARYQARELACHSYRGPRTELEPLLSPILQHFHRTA